MSEINIAAIANSKHRNAIGLVGISCDTELQQVKVRLAKHWSRDEIHLIPRRIGLLYNKIRWDNTYTDQEVGQHFIQSVKQQGLGIQVITTQKNLKEPDEIERIKVMDKIEMVQLQLKLKLNKQVLYPEKPSVTMNELESQMSLYTEHKTEAGGIDYFAPGDEFDNLTKALMICCFAVRNVLENEFSLIVGGPIRKKPPRNMADYKLILNKKGLSPFDV